MQIFSLQEVPVRVLGPQLFEKNSQLARKVVGGTTGSRGVQSGRIGPVADLSSKNLFNHLCNLNLRAETWPGLTSHQI